MQDKFTNNAVTAIEAANSAAISLSQNYVGSEHLLIGLLSVDGVAKKVLEETEFHTTDLWSLLTSY